MMLVRRWLLVALFLTGGCAAHNALESAATAERQLGDGGKAALDGVASLTSALAKTTEHVNGAVDGIAGVATAAQLAIQRLGDGTIERRLLYVIGALVLLVVVVAIHSHVRSGRAPPRVPPS